MTDEDRCHLVTAAIIACTCALIPRVERDQHMREVARILRVLAALAPTVNAAALDERVSEMLYENPGGLNS